MRRPHGRRRRGALVAAGCVLSLTATACTGSTAGTESSPAASTPTVTTAPSTPAAQQSDANELQSDYVQTIDAVLPSVVLIRTSRDLGSGVVFDDKGDIVTNDHVVGSATTFRVTPSNSARSLPAKLVGAYPPDDLAVIRVSDPSGLKPATFADSSTVQVGDIVLAIGNPLGLASSVTNGIVSAVGRTVTEPSGQGSPGATLPDTIQTSAAINPGNSGGALVNLDDEVIGIPTLAATDQQLGGAAPGIGFAISSNIVKDIAGQLIAHGKVVNSHRAALGVRVTTITDSSGKPAGVGIVAVQSGGAAAKAGLRAGDVVLAIAGRPTPAVQALTTVLANLRPGQKVDVKVQRRDGSTATVSVTLGSLPG